MKWFDAVKDFLYVHPWFQAVVFGSLIAMMGGGTVFYRRRELKHSKDLADATKKLAEANQQANEHRAELLKLQKESLQPATEKLRIRLLQLKGKPVMVTRETYRGHYPPSGAIVDDVNEDCIVLRSDGAGNQAPYTWPLTKISPETDHNGRTVIVFDDRGISRK